MNEIYLCPMTRELCHAFFRSFENDSDIFTDITLFSRYQYNKEKVNEYFEANQNASRIIFAVMLGNKPIALQNAFENMGMQEVNADTLLKNTRSQHVLEKVGFRYIREDNGYRYYRLAKGAFYDDSRGK